MIIDANGKIVGTTTKVYKEFETEAEYNAWKATLPSSAEGIAFDVRKKFLNTESIIIPVESYSKLPSSANEANPNALYFTLDTKLFYYCTVSGSSVTKNQIYAVQDIYLTYIGGEPGTWVGDGATYGGSNNLPTGTRSIYNSLTLSLILYDVPRSYLSAQNTLCNSQRLYTLLQRLYPTSMGHVAIYIPGTIAITSADKTKTWAFAESICYYPDTPGKFSVMMHLADNNTSLNDGVIWTGFNIGEVFERWDYVFTWYDPSLSDPSNLSCISQGVILH